MSDTPDTPDTTGKRHAMRVEEVAVAVEQSLERFEARKRAEDAEAKAKAERKEQLTNRVSFAAILLTMLMSFLGFARSEREGAASAASGEAARAKNDAESNWAYYLSRSAERGGYTRADNALVREIAVLPDADPRVRLAEVHHAEYAARVAAIDAETRRVFFTVQDLERERVLKEREAAHIGLKVARYDMGTRVLTLAIVLLSVTLLANRRGLFWVAVGIGTIGAFIATSGYFLLF